MSHMLLGMQKVACNHNAKYNAKNMQGKVISKYCGGSRGGKGGF